MVRISLHAKKNFSLLKPVVDPGHYFFWGGGGTAINFEIDKLFFLNALKNFPGGGIFSN